MKHFSVLKRGGVLPNRINPRALSPPLDLSETKKHMNSREEIL